ncbi:hypothetical protein THII_1667 [Thioploca ingrica]|uniref:Uncharacterized protein n=1 Tax=Thioploca ingrica TaxID=40754 RepID=A0A090AFV2_9GAMM|nr:hypothetical protein THII_1667 [Thioploca ingrica]
MDSKDTNPIQSIVKMLSKSLATGFPGLPPVAKTISILMILIVFCILLISPFFGCAGISALIIVMAAIILMAIFIALIGYYFQWDEAMQREAMQREAIHSNVKSLKEGFSITKKIIERIMEIGTIAQKGELKEKIDKLDDYLKNLDNIAEGFSIWKEAEIWLRDNQELLVKIAIRKFSAQHPELKNPGRSLDSDEKTKEFEKSIDKHVEWILKLLSLGTDRIPLNENPVISERFAYKEIFEYLRDEVKKNKKPSSDAQEAVVGRLEILIKRFNN